MIVFPPQRSERASLAHFAKSPNLDEHFSAAIFFFTDDSEEIILNQIKHAGIHSAQDSAAELAPRADPAARGIATQLQVYLVKSLLDRHHPADGLFYGVIGGRTLGAFDVIYEPSQAESVFVGRVSDSPDKGFQLWTNFRPRRVPAFVQPHPRIDDYRIDSIIHHDLTSDISADFTFKASVTDGRAISLSLSPRLKVSSATIDGTPVEVFQHPSGRLGEFNASEPLLLVAPEQLVAGHDYRIEMHYAGSIIRRTEAGGYFVDDRNTWYPVSGPVLANFDLFFHLPERLRLAATGEPIDEHVEDGVRTVHRKTPVPAALAGFNLGEYAVTEKDHNGYAIAIDSPNTALATLTADPTLPAQTERILDEYTKQWGHLPIHSLSVTPIEGYFGQGFPGLIYLSSVSYMKEQNRSAGLRTRRFNAFFSELLLPHEIAHQWWGNIVRQADYRSDWITEALANDSALEFIARDRGAGARDEILDSYREDLTKQQDDQTVESAGPLDFGERLIDTHGLSTWLVILYEKGSWVMQMLRKRLGNENFHQMQLVLLKEYGSKPLSNEDLRQVASRFVPPGQPDQTLSDFFETWVYNTGIPGLALRHTGRLFHLEVSRVAADFLAEVPLHCRGAGVFWVRAAAGDNTFEPPRGASACELPSLRDFLYTAP